jgi:hypothetical protein
MCLPVTATESATPEVSPPDPRRLGRARFGLAGVVLVFVMLGTVIAVKTPAFEAPDEPGHVQNIETLVSGRWYGMNSDCPSHLKPTTRLLQCSGDEAQQAPLYYLVLSAWQRVIGLPPRAPFRGEFNPVHYFHQDTEVFLNHSAADHRFLLWLRLPNVLFGVMTILLTFLAVRQISSDAWTPVVAASFVAFLPRFVFLTSFVTNDNLVDLFGALLVYLALRYAVSPSRWRMAAVGVAFGLLMTTKVSVLPLVVVPLALALLVKGWRRRVEFGAIGLGSSLAVSAWYLIQNIYRYGDPLARSATRNYLIKLGGIGTIQGRPYSVSDPLELVFVQVPREIGRTFWYQSGWYQFHWSWPVNVTVTVVFVCALLGLVHRRIAPHVLATLTLIAVVALATVWGVAFQTNSYTARYALVGLPAIAALFALGVERWKLPVRLVLPAIGLVGTIVAINVDVLSVHWT